MRIRWAAIAAFLLVMPLKASALPQFVLSTDEIQLGTNTDITISLVDPGTVNPAVAGWNAVFSVNPAEIEVVGLTQINPSFPSFDANGFSVNGFAAFGQGVPFDLVTVTLKGLVVGGKLTFNLAAVPPPAIGDCAGPISCLAPVVREGLETINFDPPTDSTTAATVVPEPGTFVLLGLALAGLAGLRRRQTP